MMNLGDHISRIFANRGVSKKVLCYPNLIRRLCDRAGVDFNQYAPVRRLRIDPCSRAPHPQLILDELRGANEIRFDQQITPDNFQPFVPPARRARQNQGSEGEPSIKRRRVEINAEVERNEEVPHMPGQQEMPREEVPVAPRGAATASGSRYQPPPPPPHAFGHSFESQQVTQSVMQTAYTQTLEEYNKTMATELAKTHTYMDQAMTYAGQTMAHADKALAYVGKMADNNAELVRSNQELAMGVREIARGNQENTRGTQEFLKEHTREMRAIMELLVSRLPPPPVQPQQQPPAQIPPTEEAGPSARGQQDKDAE